MDIKYSICSFDTNSRCRISKGLVVENRVMLGVSFIALICCLLYPVKLSADISKSSHGSLAVNGLEESESIDKLTNMPSNQFVFVEGGKLPDIGNGYLSVSSFYIERYEVTSSKWDRILAHASKYGYSFDNNGYAANTNHPIVSVNWYDCVKWCNLRSEVEGRQPMYLTRDGVYRSGQTDEITVSTNAFGFLLPTNAEWEYAARGGVYSKGFKYSGSDNLNEVGWYLNNSVDAVKNMNEGRGTWPVGLKKSNELGIHDMSGNVREWCYDWDPGYIGGLRVVRGGSWRYMSNYCQVASRCMNGPHFGSTTTGFRCVIKGKELPKGYSVSTNNCYGLN